jgi:hypothetical protein
VVGTDPSITLGVGNGLDNAARLVGLRGLGRLGIGVTPPIIKIFKMQQVMPRELEVPRRFEVLGQLVVPGTVAYTVAARIAASTMATEIAASTMAVGIAADIMVEKPDSTATATMAMEHIKELIHTIEGCMPEESIEQLTLAIE